MLAARRAGIHAATSATARSAATDKADVDGSSGSRRKSADLRVLPIAKAHGSPMRIPTTTIQSDSRSTMPITSPALAPSAMRTPISLVRLATAYASRPPSPIAASANATNPKAPDTKPRSRSVRSSRSINAVCV